MIWENNHASITDLLLIVGSVLIVEAVVKLLNVSILGQVIAGFIMFGVGANWAIKMLRENKKKGKKRK